MLYRTIPLIEWKKLKARQAKEEEKKTLIFKYNCEDMKQIVPRNKRKKSWGGGEGETKDVEKGILERLNTFSSEAAKRAAFW